MLPLQALLRQRETDSNQAWVVTAPSPSGCRVCRMPCPDQTTLFPWYLLFQSSFLQTSSSCLSFPTTSPPLLPHQQIKPLFFLATHSSSWLPTPPCIPYFPSAKAGYQSLEKKISNLWRRKFYMITLQWAL